MEESGKKRSRSKSRSARKHRDKEASIPNIQAKRRSGRSVVYEENEPTLGEMVDQLKLLEIEKTKKGEEKDKPSALPPSADSVHVLLKQALRADDRALLLDCLYDQDEKVIANSVSPLNSADVLKLLNSLVNFIELRGAVLVCVLPWLRSLLLHHATGIMSHESSLMALNSMYQLIDSRVATFQSAIKLSSCIDLMLTKGVDEGAHEEPIIPAVYVDQSEQEDSEDAKDTDNEK